MGTITNDYKSTSQNCVLTTGVSSLNYYNEHIQPYEKSDFLLYNCMGISSIKNIDKVDSYKVIIDFCDNNIKEIVFEILNYLLTFNPQIHVKVVYDIMLNNDDIEQCMTLLNRLDKHKLIKLEVLYQYSELPKKKDSNCWMKKLKNAFFFTGSGNTGKTSVIAALSELCNKKGHTVALIDLTETKKLINYFTNIYELTGEGFQERFKNSKNRTIDVYNYNYKNLDNGEEDRLFYNYIKRISSIYDYIFVNTDINTVYNKDRIFHFGEKVFVVHDFMPININATKQILLKFEESALNAKGNISLIYNKMVKSHCSIEFIEEKMIFKKADNNRLMPLVDLDCETFEIPYSKKTMEAMINHISHKSSIVNNVAYNYKRNIEYIYKYINNTPYVEIGDVDIIEYVKSSLQNISKHVYIKNLQQFPAYLMQSKILEKH